MFSTTSFLVAGDTNDFTAPQLPTADAGGPYTYDFPGGGAGISLNGTVVANDATDIVITWYWAITDQNPDDFGCTSPIPPYDCWYSTQTTTNTGFSDPHIEDTTFYINEYSFGVGEVLWLKLEITSSNAATVKAYSSVTVTAP